MDAPSMVHRSGDTLIVRRVVSGDHVFLDNNLPANNNFINETQEFKIPTTANLSLDDKKQRYFDDSTEGELLPQCKIKRNYSCNNCTYFTQNPRKYLTHLRDIHGEKIVINECKQCLYASRHYQKLVRHMKMVHGSTDGINVPINSRKRGAHARKDLKKKKICTQLDLNVATANMNNNFVNNFLEANMMNMNVANMHNNNNSIDIINIGNCVSPTSHLNEMDNQKNKLLKCTVCDYATPYREQLIEHEKGEHVKTKFFRCIKCSYVTHIKARFSKHVKYHSMPMIKCMMCDFRTPYKWNLDRHMKNHGGTGLFKCSICNFTADIKQSLTVHEMNHHTPPSGNSSLNRRKNKVGGTDIMDDELSSSFDAITDEKHALLSFLSHGSFSSNFGQEDTSPVDEPRDESTPKKKSRPIPNLIPIQPTAVTTSTPLKEPEVVCKLPGNSTLNDFTKLFFNTSLIVQESKKLNDSYDQSSSAESSSSMNLKKKNITFFDKLREKLITGVNKEDELACLCGYVAKSLSDSIIHQKSCSSKNDDKPMNLSSTGTALMMGSTRCMYCRHRCKSSADLTSHLQKCVDAQQNDNNGMTIPDSDASEEATVDDPSEPHPMENIVFVWNKLIEMQNGKENNVDENNSSQLSNESGDDEGSSSPDKRNETYFGVETAPGYGEVTKKMQAEDQAAGILMKKVFKCPHCSFWASTASRFHVHIVGHLNKKPFECSLCSYRSNWRWDITKHIRLKTIRDPSHKDAGVLMNDETGRRNYTKYNKYITLMKVTDNNSNETKNYTKTSSASVELCNNSEIFSSSDEQQPTNHSAKHFAQEQQQEQQRKIMEYNAMLQQLCQFDSSKTMLQQQHNHDNNILQPLNLEQKQMSNNDTITQQQQQFIDNANNKKIHFKCRKCNFKNANREIVLEHVKTHYRTAGLLSDDSSSGRNSNDLPKDLTTEEIETFYGGRSVPSSVSITTTESSPLAMTTTSSPSTPSNMVMGANIGAILSGTLGTVKTGVLNNGEMDEASSKGITAPGWRGSAPYRCGHCHQVSNWKHVIQRHCRLKHNGNILIELVNQTNGGCNVDGRQKKNIKRHVPENNAISSLEFSSRIPIDVGHKTKAEEPTNQIHFYTPPPPPAAPLPPQQTVEQPILITPTVQITPITQPPPTPLMPTVLENMDLSDDNKNAIDHSQLSHLHSFNRRSKRYQCMYCPYVTDSKSQFLYHKSFHKPRGEPFKCIFCSYNVTKKHLLNQHMKMHNESGAGENKSSDIINVDDDDDEDESESPINDTEKQEQILDLTKKESAIPTVVHQPNNKESEERKIHYCSMCPARYLSLKEIQLHHKFHATELSFKCNMCTYSSRQECHLQAHKTVHTTYYQEKTKEFQGKYPSSRAYGQPKIIVSPSINGSPQMTIASLSADDLKWTVAPQIIPQESPNPVMVEDFEDVISSTKVLNKASDEGDNSTIEESAITNVEASDKEKCPHCPFSTNAVDILKSHLDHHLNVSGGTKQKFQCDHCDYSVNHEPHFNDHFKLHFSAILTTHKNIKLFTNLNNRNNNNKSSNLELYAYEKNNRNNMEVIYIDNNNDNDRNGDFFIDENLEKLDKNNIILNF